MRTRFLRFATVLCVTAGPSRSGGDDKPAEETVVWKIDNLRKIGGHEVRVRRRAADHRERQGEGRRVRRAGRRPVSRHSPTRRGEAVHGRGDLPARCRRPRRTALLPHAGERHENRILFETRLTPDGQWFLDTFIKSGEGGNTQFAEKFEHPIGRWYHAAIVRRRRGNAALRRRQGWK